MHADYEVPNSQQFPVRLERPFDVSKPRGKRGKAILLACWRLYQPRMKGAKDQRPWVC